jgi:hypothetical protein
MMMVAMVASSGLAGVSAATSDISGSVTDSDGNGIEGATVEVVNENGTVVASATTGTGGVYSITGLTDGTSYSVEVSATGYQSVSESYSTGTGTSDTLDYSLLATTLSADSDKSASTVFVELNDPVETTVTVEVLGSDGNYTQVASKTVTPSDTPQSVEIDVSDYSDSSEFRVSVSGQKASDTGILYEGGGAGAVIGTGSGGSSILLSVIVAGGAYFLMRD